MVEGPLLLRGLSSKLYPNLMRWDQLSPAFCGFVYLAPDWLPTAVCYDLQSSMRLFFDQILGRTGSFVVDAAETVEAVRHMLLNSYTDGATPFFWAESDDWDREVEQFVRGVQLSAV